MFATVGPDARPDSLVPQLRVLYVSAAAIVPDLDPGAFDDDRNHAPAPAVAQHPVHGLFALQHVEIIERDFSLPVSLPGLQCVRSGVLSKNQHFFLHISSYIWIT
ncbi:MAG: hypothetical protein H6Q05_4638 [Acidobacteria bacterium]|nr:hypothetical protein [Acidobacteriota bacterium]